MNAFLIECFFSFSPVLLPSPPSLPPLSTMAVPVCCLYLFLFLSGFVQAYTSLILSGHYLRFDAVDYLHLAAVNCLVVHLKTISQFFQTIFFFFYLSPPQFATLPPSPTTPPLHATFLVVVCLPCGRTWISRAT